MSGTRRPIRGLVFDKDGTLFDFHATWSAWCGGFIEALAEGDEARAGALARALGFDLGTGQFVPESPVIAGTMEVPIARVMGVLPALDEVWLRAMVMESTAAAAQVEVTPLVALLDRLVAAGLTLGLATNDAELPARAHLARAGILGHFAFVAGYDSGHGAKPEAGPLSAFCAATGIPPSACAMVGDSTHDLDSGRAAGMVTVAVLTGPASRADLEPHADVVLADIGGLPGWLGLA